MNFEILDKDGKSLIKSLTDSVSLSYTQNGVSKSIHLSIQQLKVSATDNTNSNKYNGFFITDLGKLGSLSDLSPAVSNFTLSVNGVAQGVLFIAYQQYYTAPTSAYNTQYFTFNNVPVTIDGTLYLDMFVIKTF